MPNTLTEEQRRMLTEGVLWEWHYFTVCWLVAKFWEGK